MAFEFALHHLNTDALTLAYFQVPWDSDIFGFPVGQITHIQVDDPTEAGVELGAFQAWLQEREIQLVSCRLAHDRLRESMFLEQAGFRFVEMVLHPHVADLQGYSCAPQGLRVERAVESDLTDIEAIATRAFGYERFHADPRLQPDLADRRYQTWVRNSCNHAQQRLYKISDGPDLVAFFVTENHPDGLCYWHLTAIAPELQGRGYGKRVWREMLRHHQREGMARVATTIAARNTPVLNLYSSLDFRFQPPEMTFHWLRDA